MIGEPHTSPPESEGGPRASAARRAVLSPIDRLTEFLYGIILVLTFTGTLGKLPVPPRARVTRDDVAGAVGIFLLANAALLPLAAPFLLIDDVELAQHVSNGLALVMLFAAGHGLGRYTAERPLWVGLRFTAFGAVLVAATIALGG